MKRILLVNPWIYDFKCHDFWIKPFGLLRIASLLKDKGFKVDLIDCMDRQDESIPDEFRQSDEYGKGRFYSEIIVEKPKPYNKVPRNYKRYGITPDAFTKKLEKLEKPDLILVTSGMTYTYEGVHHAISMLKENFSGVHIILGGIYATLCFDHAREKSGANTVWKGDINNYFLMSLNRLTGVSFDPMEENDFNELIPDYSFYPHTPYVVMRLTKGCPYTCTYCAIKELCEGFYQRKPENILKEFDLYHNRGIKNIAFYDDALFYKNHFIKQILRELIIRKYRFYLHTPNGLHAAYIDGELAVLMKQAGFVDVRVSLETSDYSMQKKTGGKISNDLFEEAVKSLQKAGYDNDSIGVYLLAGMPGQDLDSILKDVDYVKQFDLKVKIANYSPMTATADFAKFRSDVKAGLQKEPLTQNEFYFLSINTDFNWKMFQQVKEEIQEQDEE
jgi:radical SAM superfamily enzyme YgiQ (UPF0313 family)